VDELADSASLLNDHEGLRRRLAADGYLFFRGLLSAAQVRAAGDAVLAQLRSGGWIDDRGIPSIQPRAVNSMDALADPACSRSGRAAARDVQPAVPPRAVVGARARRADPASPGADDHRPAGSLPPDPRAPRLAALAATPSHGALTVRSTRHPLNTCLAHLRR